MVTNRQMKQEILVFIGSLGRGGAEIHLSQILPDLHRRGLEVKVFLLSSKGDLYDQLQKQGVPIVSPWFEKSVQNPLVKVLKLSINSLQALCHLLLKRPQIAHFFLPQSYLVAGFLSVLARTPVRIMSRRSLNYYQRKYPAFVRKLECWLHGKMTALLGNSQKVVQQLICEEGADPKRTHLIYNGIDLPPVPEAQDTRSHLGLAPESIVLAMVANLIPYKGHADLINALAQLDPSQPWEVVFIGNDSSHIQADLQQLARKAGIESRLHFLGKRDNVATILKCADIGLLTSHEEGFSNAILEAMASGLPMVVTDVGGNAEAVHDGENGYVVPPHAPAQLAEALETLLHDPQLRTRFGQNSLKRQQQLFTRKACVDAYQEFYQNLLKTHGE